MGQFLQGGLRPCLCQRRQYQCCCTCHSRRYHCESTRVIARDLEYFSGRPFQRMDHDFNAPQRYYRITCWELQSRC